MSSSSPSDTITVFFGPTSGCVRYTLISSLRARHFCRALARSPEKLLTVLAHYAVPQSLIDTYLTIVKGDISSVDDITRTLTDDNGRTVDTIVSGIGGAPQLGNSLFMPMRIPDPDVCRTGVANMLAALANIQGGKVEKPGKKPFLCVISSRGVVGSPRDYPLSMAIFYKWILNGTLPDKRAMESLILSEEAKSPSERVTIGTCIVRPSHLTDGASQGMDKIRVGDTQSPVNGYSINRDDVGLWIYEKVVKRDRSLDGVEGKGPQGAWGLTY